MSAAKSSGFDIKRSVVETLVAGLLALIVFGPVVGVVLDGYSFMAEPRRVAMLVGVVMIGRFVLSLFLQTDTGQRMLQGFDNGGSGVHVLAPDYKSRLRWIIPALIVIAIVFPIFANKYLLTVVILGLIYVLLGLGLNIVVGLATSPSTPSGPTAWRWATSTWAWVSGACCRWRRSPRRWPVASSVSRCCACMATTWPS
jgi:branched-chain amino acid transport system permease protein